MTDTSSMQPTSGFEVIHDWPETKSTFDAAMSCLRRYFGELNHLHGSSREPSNKDLAYLFRYLAQYLVNTENHSPLSASIDQNIFAPVRQNSADSLIGWLHAPEREAPWNQFTGRRRISTDEANPSPLVGEHGDPLSGLLGGSIPYTARTPLSMDPASQSHLDPGLQSSGLPQILQNEANILSFSAFSRSVGPASIAFSNDIGQVSLLSQPSPTASIPTSPFPGTPNNPPTAMDNDGSPALVSTPPSNPVSEFGIVEDGTVRGSGRQRGPTFAEITAGTTIQSRTPSVVSGTKSNRFHCEYDDCERTFDWKWKYKDHVKSHTKEKPFWCHDCNAPFGRERDLLKHQQSSQKHKKACENSKKNDRDPHKPAQKPGLQRAPPKKSGRVLRGAGQGGLIVGNSRTHGSSPGPMGDGQEASIEFGNSSRNVSMPALGPSCIAHQYIGQDAFNRPRSAKRTYSDIDSNRDDDEYEEQHCEFTGADGCSFRVDSQSSEYTNSLPPTCIIQSLQQSHLSHPSHPNTNPSYGPVPAITYSFPSVSSGYGTNWAGTSRTSGSSTAEDEMAQFIDYDQTQPVYSQSSYYTGGRDGGQG